MPYKSEKQRRYMHANLPRIAERWDKETPSGKRLPRKTNGTKAKTRRTRDEE
jgi:hypothetical protein